MCDAIKYGAKRVPRVRKFSQTLVLSFVLQTKSNRTYTHSSMNKLFGFCGFYHSFIIFYSRHLIYIVFAAILFNRAPSFHSSCSFYLFTSFSIK